MTTENRQLIHREMTIQEILGTFPEKSQRIAQALTNAGLHCVGCHAATWETLEVGMMGHGFDEKALNDLVDELNQILAEKVDTSTITLTKRAAKQFQDILKQDRKEGWGLRFGDKPGGCGGFEYVLDFAEKEAEDDQVFESEGVKIYVNRKMLHRLMGCQIDYLEGLMGSGFKVTNPNVKGSCSCGNSQSY